MPAPLPPCPPTPRPSQVVALLYYLTSYYPGGTDTVRWVLGMFGSAVTRCFGMLFSK
jgi:hypothetical protein